jgi:hypothetical protein
MYLKSGMFAVTFLTSHIFLKTKIDSRFRKLIDPYFEKY